MSRIKVLVDKQSLTEALTKFDVPGTFKNRSELYGAVATYMNLTPGVVGLRIKEYKLDTTLQTPMGRRGNPNLAGTPKGPRVGRGEKMKQYGETFRRLRNRMDVGFQPTIDRAQAGSLAAIIKLKCLECSNGQRKEVQYCQVVGCPLYCVRPYK